MDGDKTNSTFTYDRPSPIVANRECERTRHIMNVGAVIRIAAMLTLLFVFAGALVVERPPIDSSLGPKPMM